MERDLDAEWLAERDALILALLGQCFRVGTDGHCSLIRPLAAKELDAETNATLLPQLAAYLRAIAAKARALGGRCSETISRATADGRVEMMLHAVPLPSGTVIVTAQSSAAKAGGVEVATLIHDLTNPLTYVLASLGLLRESLAERSLDRHPDVLELLEALDDGLGRIHGVLRGLNTRTQAAPSEGRLPARPLPGPRVARDHGMLARILVVDDEPQLLESLSRLLSPHEVETASSGLEALDSLAHRPLPDVIFCDVMMPGMDGLELVSRIVARWPGLAQRIVFVTGGVADPDMAQRLSEMPFPILEKPLRDGPLREQVVRILELHRDENRLSNFGDEDDNGSQVA